MAIAPAVVWRLRVAVRAEEFKILEPVVVAIAVHVVQRHRERLPAPVGDPALLAPILLEPRTEEPVLKVASSARSSRHKELANRRDPVAWHEFASLHGFSPSIAGETEAIHASAQRQAGIHRALDLRPVVSQCESIISGFPKTPGVIGHRRLRKAQPSRDLDVRQAVLP